MYFLNNRNEEVNRVLALHILLTKFPNSNGTSLFPWPQRGAWRMKQKEMSLSIFPASLRAPGSIRCKLLILTGQDAEYKQTADSKGVGIYTEFAETCHGACKWMFANVLLDGILLFLKSRRVKSASDNIAIWSYKQIFSFLSETPPAP